MKIISSIFLLSAICFVASGQTDQQINNQKTFARLFGYVRYFYPGDEAQTINWDKFAVYGTSQVDQCKTPEELKTTLNNIFLPLAPSLKIFETEENLQFDATALNAPDKKKYVTIAWQHQGVAFANTPRRSVYVSKRTNRPYYENGKEGYPFKKYANVGEYIHKEIGSSLSCFIPLALYGDSFNTYPVADTANLNALKNNVDAISDSSLTGKDLYLRLADVIIAWNVFQHFYMYFDVAKTNWAEDLTIALKNAYQDKTEADFLLTLQKLTAQLKDGHVRVNCKSIPLREYLLPLTWRMVENKLVVTSIMDKHIPLHRGDVITKINDVPAEEYYRITSTHISAATNGWLQSRANMETLSGYENSEVELTYSNIQDEEEIVTLKRTMKISDLKLYYNSIPKIKKIKDDIYYVNIAGVTDSALDSLMPVLVKCKSIIFDLRGYPTINKELLTHLLTRKDTSKMWMRVPQIIYPDRENITGFRNFGWELKPKKPHLDAKIIFITDGSAISYAESFMSFIENYKLATIIGQPTAGTNGNINPFTMPGGYSITWTGMKVLKHDGSQHHGVGIQPNILIDKTIAGVRAGKDEYLEKAIEIADQ
ncbi:S41 family peptidase [soil metagenome]